MTIVLRFVLFVGKSVCVFCPRLNIISSSIFGQKGNCVHKKGNEVTRRLKVMSWSRSVMRHLEINWTVIAGFVLVRFRDRGSICLKQSETIRIQRGNIPNLVVTSKRYLCHYFSSQSAHISLHPLEPIMSCLPMPNWVGNELKIGLSSLCSVTLSWPLDLHEKDLSVVSSNWCVHLLGSWWKVK